MFILRTAFIKLRIKEPSVRNGRLAEMMHKYAGKVLSLFNVTVSVSGNTERFNDPAPCLMLSNHLSYTDIIVIAAMRPTLFLTHTGIQKEPLIGWLAEGGGSLFVDRSSKAKLQSEMGRLAGFMQEGNTMTLFPEGTTFSGDAVMPFHSAFIEAAVVAKVDVLPLYIEYESFNGEKLSRENRDNIFIYGDKPFLPHIWNLYRKIRRMEITLHVFASIEGGNRKEISEKARQSMISVHKPL